MKPVLSKSTGWILLTALVFVDALLDVVISGGGQLARSDFVSWRFVD
jgi:hypothetical protein